MAMRVLLLASDAFGGHGGIASFNRALAAALAAQAAVEQVVILPRRARRAAGPLPDRVVQLPPPAGKAAYAFDVLRRVSTSRFDLIVCGHVNLLPVASVARVLARRPGRPSRLALVVHGIDAWAPVPVPGLSGVDLTLSVSQLTLDRFVDWSRFPRSRSMVLPNTFDDTFQPGPKPADLVGRYGLEGHEVVMVLARLDRTDRDKGVIEMLRALPALAQTRPSIRYLVCGDGDDRGWLQQEARRLGVADRVVFTGFVDEPEKAGHYRLADTFVLCGRQEGFGIVLLEAIACGVPVVASMVDGSREAVMDGVLGGLADPGDPESLRDAVLRALDRPREDLRGRLEAAFGREAFATRVSEIMARLV